MIHYRHLIDGEWVASPDEIESVDPATGEVWAGFARGDAAIADRAVEAAARAFRSDPWSRCDGEARALHLMRLADTLEQRWEELVTPEVRDNGKRIAEVRAQFAGLHRWYRHFAEAARALGPEAQANAVPGVTSETRHVPYGVVVAITPWNSPLMILAWKLGPALAAGNTVVVKPSELASASTLEFARLAHDAGLPPGVLNVVTGHGHGVGEALVRHPLTRKVSFTGSTGGGRRIATAAAAGVVPVTLELGGKSPQLVFADADLDNAVNGIMSGIFLSNGQTCVAGARLIVEDPVREAITERLIARARALRIDDPMDPATEVGPLANPAHLGKVTAMVDRAAAEGARCLLDGRQAVTGRPGCWFGPTIFGDVTPAMQLWREEVFGPVLAITGFSSEDEAIRLANDSDFGLAAGIWTSDPERAARVADAVEAGTVYINHYRSTDPASPVGGMKLSGYGRELGPDAVKDFLQVKSVWTGTAPVPDPFPRRPDRAEPT